MHTQIAPAHPRSSGLSAPSCVPFGSKRQSRAAVISNNLPIDGYFPPSDHQAFRRAGPKGGKALTDITVFCSLKISNKQEQSVIDERIWQRHNTGNGTASHSQRLRFLASGREDSPSWRIDGETDIYSVGGEQSDDYQNLLVAARKAVEFGYKVYMLPNPRSIRTADFIFEKKGTFRVYDLKTVFGKSSVGQNLQDSIGQCNRILLNITTEYNTRLLAFAIERYFELNHEAKEVLIFKGHKRLSVNRDMVTGNDFLRKFLRKYER